MKTKLETEGLRQLPNSKWLQDVLSLDRESIQGLYDDDVYWEGASKSDGEEKSKNERNSLKEDLEMMDSVLERCVKTGLDEPIYFTEKEWDWVSNLLLAEGEMYESYSPWGVNEDYDESNEEHVKWWVSYNRYVSIVKKEKTGFRFPECGCRAGYGCQLAYVNIEDKIYKRDTGHIHDDQEAIDILLKDGMDMKSIYRLIHRPCRMCHTHYGKVHHHPCEMERCPKCHQQFVSCDHDHDTIYYKGPEDHDGIYNRGLMWSLYEHYDFEIPCDWSERVWLRDFLEGVIDTCSISLNDPNFYSDSSSSGEKLGVRAGLLDDIEIAKDILIMLDHGCQCLTLTGKQTKKFEHALTYQSMHLRGCKDSIIAENKKLDRYTDLQDDDHNYFIQDELKYVDKFLNIISDIRSKHEMR